MISTHTPLAGRDPLSRLCTRLGNISTHTPLAGRDESLANMSRNSCNFYSHAPRGARLRQFTIWMR